MGWRGRKFTFGLDELRVTQAHETEAQCVRRVAKQKVRLDSLGIFDSQTNAFRERTMLRVMLSQVV